MKQKKIKKIHGGCLLVAIDQPTLKLAAVTQGFVAPVSESHPHLPADSR